MAIDFGNTPGNLFNRLAAYGMALNAINEFRGTDGTVNISDLVDAVRDEFADADTDLLDGLYTALRSYQGTHASFLQNIKSRCEQIAIRMVNDDVVLSSSSMLTVWTEIIRQAVVQVQSVHKPSITLTNATGSSNTGGGRTVSSYKNPVGVARDTLFAEVLDLLCTRDSQQGGTEGQETFSVIGDLVSNDPLAWDWPKGSGTSGTLTAVDATEDDGANKLTNSSFTDFTSNIPDQWTLLVGSGGTDIFNAGSSAALGSEGSALQFTGTGGGPLSSLVQTFDSSSGTEGTLAANTVYHYSFWAKRTTSLAAGVLEVGLVDGSNAAVSDDASTANTRSISYSSLTTSYAHFGGAFITPKLMPSVIKLRVRCSTALTSGESLYVDHLSLSSASLLYTGGPYLTVHSHPTAFLLNDTFTLTVTNDWLTEALWVVLLERLFGLRSLGLQFPTVTGTGETIADSMLES